MTSPARRLLEERLATLSDDLDSLFAESRQNAQREYAERLNQAVRRLRIAGDTEELCGTLASAAAQFAEGAMLFQIDSGVASHPRIDVPLVSAAAFAGAVESREPQTAATTAAEVSAELVDLLGLSPNGRTSIFPVDAADHVPVVICTWGNANVAAIELLAQVTGAVWSTLAIEEEPEPEPAPPLVQIAAAAPAEPRASAADWESLPSEEQQLHLRAQRFARVHVAEMRLYEADAVKAGRARRELYDVLRNPIDAARAAFREQFFARCPSMVDYLHLELMRTLANDEPDLFGKDYPGPLV
jgi:hypothetical protein